MDEIRSLIGMFDAKEWMSFVSTTTSVALILVLAILARSLAHRMIRGFRTYVQARDDDAGRAQRVETLGRTFRYITTVVIVIVAGSLVLDALGISVAPILATAGVAGIAVGFAAQSLIKDYFNGFFILLEDQIRQGEIVNVGGVSGVVEAMTLRYVRLRNYDGHVHFVPNGEIKVVINLTREFAQAVADVGIAYRENVDEAIAVIKEVGAAMRADEAIAPTILADLDVAGVESLGDSAVVVRCRFKVKGGEQWTVRREFLKRIKAAFDARGIEIPYPHLTLYAGQAKDGSAPPLRVVSEAKA
ncbi:MAG: mechanosensitive ion channel family protein [Proteobacteria bacterium]|nr:mechanosensitive ion channel family protein [Pseudomonadota bacterium]